MKRPDPKSLAELETLVMNEVWKRGRATVRQVREDLAKRRELAYTTILTTLRNLERKGFLTHETEGRVHVYIPAVDRKTVARSRARDLLERFFDGSRAGLVIALFEEEEIGPEEYEQLRRAIREARRREGKSDE